MEYKYDALGREIQIGHFIVYPTNMGSKSIIKIFEVVGIRKTPFRPHEMHPGKNMYYTLHVVERILFDSVKSSYAGRTRVLNYPEKCIIVPKECLKKVTWDDNEEFMEPNQAYV